MRSLTDRQKSNTKNIMKFHNFNLPFAWPKNIVNPDNFQLPPKNGHSKLLYPWGDQSKFQTILVSHANPAKLSAVLFSDFHQLNLYGPQSTMVDDFTKLG